MNDAIQRALQEPVEQGDVPALAGIVVDKGGVVFEGQATPLNSTERAARNKARGQ